MPIIESKDNKVIFSHIPKTGGTTVERIFEESSEINVFFKNRTGAKKNSGGLPCSPQHFHGKMLSYIFGTNIKSYALVRSPVARIISEYKWSNKIIKMGDTASIDFDSWVEMKFERLKAEPFLNDNHLRLQKDFLLSNTQWFKLEENGIAKIVDNICVDLNVDKIFLKHSIMANKTADVSIIPSKETIDLIENMYEQDFIAFDY